MGQQGKTLAAVEIVAGGPDREICEMGVSIKSPESQKSASK
jgi:hypothetical protein